MTAPQAAPPLQRVLVVHNAYQQRGGEDAVVEAECALLEQHGHAVALYRRSNDDVSGMSRLALVRDTVWSARTTQDLQQQVAAFRPDIVHVHNTLPLISPSVFWAARRAGLPVVKTLHNFRLICPQALLLREGKVCEDCVGKVPWRAALHGCYRQSRPLSAAVAGSVQWHRTIGTWSRQVSLYIALNEFCKAKFIEGGLLAAKIRVKPNFVDLPQPASQERSGFLFVGRLSHEKGIGVLASCAPLLPPECTVQLVGDGPDRALLNGLANLQCLGPRAPDDIYARMARATALVLPSIWYENHPRTLVEAFACGLPVIASRIGALATLVEDGRTGLLFEPGNGADLAAKLRYAQTHPQAMAQMGEQARHYYESTLTPEVNYRQLRSIYDEASAKP